MEKEIDRLTKRVQETQGEFTMALDLLTAPREKLEEQLKVRDNEWLLTELGGEGAKPKPTMIGLIGDRTYLFASSRHDAVFFPRPIQTIGTS